MSIQKKLMPFSVWCCITVFYCYQYVLRLIPNIIMPELFQKFNIGAAEFSDFAGIYYIGYITMHIPAGLLFSRYGVKKILPFFIAIAAIGMMPIIYSSNWHYVIFGRMLVGLGSTAAIIAAFQIYRIIFPKNASRVLGSTVCVGLITAVYINIPLTNIIKNVGINQAINILIIIGILLAISIFFLAPNRNEENKDSSITEDLKIIIKNYKLVIVALLSGLMVGPLEGFADAWGSSFISCIYNIDRANANYIISFILTGMCIGSIILPYVADKFQAYYSVTIFSAASMIVGFEVLLNATISNSNYLISICLAIGICCAYQIVILTKISSFVSQRLSGLAAAFGNMIIMAFGYIFHKSIGIMMDLNWQGEIEAGVKIYEPSAFISSLTIIPVGIMIALIGFIIIAKKESADRI